MDDRAFLLDAMLGKLATYLRMYGYDAAYALDRDVEGDDRLRSIARAEGRVLLTRDRSLAAGTDEALLVRSRAVDEQLRELLAAGVDLTAARTPSRCGRCNGRLEAVEAGTPTPEYAPDPGTEDVWQCRSCGQYFWKGSHWADVMETFPDRARPSAEDRRL